MSEPTKIRAFDFKTKKTLYEFDSINDAARALKINPSQIRGYLAGRTNEVKGFGFKHITEKVYQTWQNY